jgi:hypothetical protein
MHDQPDDLIAYEWPPCAAGPAQGRGSHPLWTDELDRLVCRPCEDRTAARIAELPNLFRKLDRLSSLMKGSRPVSVGSSGSRTAPIPPRLDALDLVGPGGVATKLQAIEDAWRLALGRRITPRSDGVRLFASWRIHPATAVPEHAAFLGINLRLACESYESIGQDIETIRSLHATCTAVVEQKPKTGNVKIGLCPELIDGERCFEQLYATTRSFKTECGNCGAVWEGEDEWRALRAAQARALGDAEGVAA